MFTNPPDHNARPARAVIVLASLGESASADSLEELSDAEVERGSQAVACLEKIGPDATEVARDEFDSAKRLLDIARFNALHHADGQQFANVIHNEHPEIVQTGGVPAMAEMFNPLDWGTSKEMLSSIQSQHSDLQTLPKISVAERGAEMVRTDIEASAPTQIREAEAAQQRVIALARQLELQGTVTLELPVGEQYVS